MGLSYTEFDTTQQNLLADLRAAILASTDWSRLTGDTALLSTSGSVAAGGTSIPFTSTTGSGIAIGSIIAIDAPGSLREYRAVTAITTTAITVAALSYAHASATNIYWGNEVYQATTTRGAKMIVDFSDAALTQTALSLRFWRDYAVPTSGVPGAGTDGIAKYLFWRSTGGTSAQNLHVIVSASKEHLFVSIEGPRPGESSPVSATVGSSRQYMFIADMVPYHVGDTTPVVVCAASNAFVASSSVGNIPYNVHTSRNYANTGSWQSAKLLTLTAPAGNMAETIGAQRQTTGDGNFYLAPYVVVGDDCGFRGRLNKFYYAGYTFSTNPDVPVAAVGSTLTYDGGTYKLLAVNKSDGSTNQYGPFGAVDNAATSTYWRSPIVAVQSA